MFSQRREKLNVTIERKGIVSSAQRCCKTFTSRENLPVWRCGSQSQRVMTRLSSPLLSPTRPSFCPSFPHPRVPPLPHWYWKEDESLGLTTQQAERRAGRDGVGRHSCLAPRTRRSGSVSVQAATSLLPSGGPWEGSLDAARGTITLGTPAALKVLSGKLL